MFSAGNETSSVSAKFAMEEILRDERNAIEVAQEKTKLRWAKIFRRQPHKDVHASGTFVAILSRWCAGGRSLATR